MSRVAGAAGRAALSGSGICQAEPAADALGRPGAALGAGVRALPVGGIFKSAAVEVLRRERRLMPTGEICRLALEWGLLNCSGKTPEATMASALYGDIKRKDRRSLFIRPQEGLFGLREWVDQGFLPPLPSNSALMAANKRGGGGGGGARSSTGRAGKRRRGARARAGASDNEEWSEGEEEGGAGASEAPSLTCTQGGLGYSANSSFDGFPVPLPPGPDLQQAPAGAPGLHVLGDVATSPLQKLLSQGPSAFEVCAGPALAMPDMVPQLGSSAQQPDLPASPSATANAVGQAAGAGAGAGDATRRRLHMDLPGSGPAADLLKSPPLYMALQSPLITGQLGSADCGVNGSKGRHESMFSPTSFPAFSPGPGSSLHPIDATPAALRSLFPSGSQARTSEGGGAGTAAQGVSLTAGVVAAAAVAGTAMAAPTASVVLKREQPAPGSWVLVPSASSMDQQVVIHHGSSSIGGMSLCAPAGLHQQTPVGESAGARQPEQEGGTAMVPLFGGHAMCQATGLALPGAGSPHEAAGVFAKIAELETKVVGVETRWGVSHPQTGRAYLLLYHACRHRAVAPFLHSKGEAALSRACAILRDNKGVVSAEDYAALLEGLRH